MAVRIEDAGFEIRDMIAWVYGSGFPKSLNVAKAIGEDDPAAIQWQGWGTAIKPALEPITVARKPLAGTVAANVLAWGTGAINVDGGRVGTGEARPLLEHTGRDGKVFGAGLEGSRAIGTTNIGRFPANLIHDGSDEVVWLFPETGASSATARNNGAREGNSKGADLPHTTHGHDDNGGSAARFFYCAKASKADRGGDNKHPTVKPTDLMRYLCRLVTPPGGVVLDPFTGSGSTGKAATLEGFRFIGIEREAEYVQIAKARIAAVDAGAGPLFA
jgi:site-specific DNA-methyltransferase (adenine-specific)